MVDYVRYKGKKGQRPPPIIRAKYYELRAPMDIQAARAQGFPTPGFGLSRRQACMRVGVSVSTGIKWDAEKGELFAKGELVIGPDIAPAPKGYDMLSDDAKKGCEDFAFFCEHYLDLQAPGYFVEMARIISNDAACEVSQEKLARMWPQLKGLSKPLLPPPMEKGAIRRLLIIIHPGVGKTMCLLAYILWRITRERAYGSEHYSITYGTKSDRLAQRGLRQLKDWMDNQKLLVDDYGRFQPSAEDTNQLWTKVDVAVAGMGRGKEATISVWASGANIRGVRPNEAIWDDLIDTDDVLPERTKEIADWWDDNPARRIEPGGTVVVVGNFIAPSDFYHVLAKRTYQFVDGDEITEEQAWHVVKYPAHDELRCPANGKHYAYPVGCLLWPQRWSFKELERVRQDNPSRFAIQFQLDDEAQDDILVPEIWIRGGVGDEQELYPGCLDVERDMWDKPDVRDPVIIGTLDPSPGKFSAVQLWAREGAFDYLIATEKRRMRSPEYPVIIAEWTMRAREIFGRFDAWIVEKTGSQYLHQSKEMEFLWGSLGVVLIPHESQRNKRDPEYGVWGNRNQFRWGRVRIPWAPGPTREAMRAFVQEHQAYPFHGTDDQVMAAWFYQLHKDRVPRMSFEPPRREVPSWLNSR